MIKSFINKIVYVYLFFVVFATNASASLPQLDPNYFAQQIFWLVIVFLALYVFIHYIVAPKIFGIKADRKNKIFLNIELATQDQKTIASITSKIKENLIQADKIKTDTFNESKDKVKALSDEKYEKIEIYKKKSLEKLNNELSEYEASIKSEKEELIDSVSKEILLKLNIK